MDSKALMLTRKEEDESNNTIAEAGVAKNTGKINQSNTFGGDDQTFLYQQLNNVSLLAKRLILALKKELELLQEITQQRRFLSEETRMSSKRKYKD